MDSVHWFSIVIGALVASWTIYRAVSAVSKILYLRLTYWVLKHVVYPQLPKLFRGSETLTRCSLLLLVLYGLSNVICVYLGHPGIQTLIQRTGHMAMINSIPLGIIGRTNIFTNYLNLSLRAQVQVHRYLGWAVLLHSVVHAYSAIRARKSGTQLTRIAGYTVYQVRCYLFKEP
jgi:hypothetical protein